MSGILAAMLGAEGGQVFDTRLSTTDKSPDYGVDTGGETAGLGANRSAAGNAWRMGRATVGRNEGRWYFEARPRITATSGYLIMGLANANAPLDTYLNTDNNGVAFISNGDVRRGSNLTAATAQAWTTATQWARLAVDLDADVFWASVVGGNWNGSPTANPATGAGGVAMPASMVSDGKLIIPAYSIYQQGLGIIFNFGASAFAGAPPAGFSAWNG